MISGTYKTKDITVTATFFSELSNPPIACVKVTPNVDSTVSTYASMRESIFYKIFTRVEADTYSILSMDIEIQQFPTGITTLLNGTDVELPKLSCIVYTDINLLEGFVCDESFVDTMFERINICDEKSEEIIDNSSDITEQEVNEEANISPSTIARTVALFVVSIMSILKASGLIDKADVDNDTIYGLILSVLNVIIAIRCWWKNNSFTNAAIKADEYMSKIKDKDDSNLSQ